MPVLPVTSITAAVSAFMLVALSAPITLRRVKVGTPSGLGSDEGLHRRIRAQGNFVEYAPLGLIVLGLAEAAGAAQAILIATAASLLGGRAVHAAGMYAGSIPLRVVGMVATYTALAVPAGLLLAKA